MKTVSGAQAFLRAHPIAKALPMSRAMQDRLATRYVEGRNYGWNHSKAKKYAVGFENPALLYLAALAIQVLFALLKLWWDKRYASV